MPKVWWWFGGLLHLTANVYGQVDRGGLTGTVKDSSGLAVPPRRTSHIPAKPEVKPLGTRSRLNSQFASKGRLNFDA